MKKKRAELESEPKNKKQNKLQHALYTTTNWLKIGDNRGPLQ